MMTVLSISLPPVWGSSSWGNSTKISTISLARSPHATMITTSTFACRAMACCNTVFPLPNGPGIKPVPPSASGFIISIILIPVSSNLLGRIFSLYPFNALITGHFCSIVTTISFPFLSSSNAIVSVILYRPASANFFIRNSPSNLKGTIILCGIFFSFTSPSQLPG